MFNWNVGQIIPSQVPLDLTKILIIYNSSNSQSKTNADWYAAARGIDGGVAGSYQYLGFALGSGDLRTVRDAGAHSSALLIDDGTLTCSASLSSAYNGQGLVTAIANCIADHGIQMVFSESLVPQNLYGPFTYPISPVGFFSLCPTLVNVAAANRTSDRNVIGSAGSGGLNYTFNDVTKKLPSQYGRKWLTFNKNIPCGRIGYFGCSTVELQRCVNDAIWAESQDNRGKLHVIGGNAYTAGGDLAHTQQANTFFANFLPDLSHLGYFNKTVATWQGTAGVFDWDGFCSGATPITPNPFATLFSANPYAGAGVPIVLNTQYARGGWAYDWGSGAFWAGYASVQNGACSAITDESEPFAYGLPSIDAVAAALVAGLTMAEAVFLSGTIQNDNTMRLYNSMAHGDPLYTPYKHNPMQLTVESY
jgi:hypothetical protein